MTAAWPMQDGPYSMMPTHRESVERAVMGSLKRSAFIAGLNAASGLVGYGWNKYRKLEHPSHPNFAVTLPIRRRWKPKYKRYRYVKRRNRRGYWKPYGYRFY